MAIELRDSYKQITWDISRQLNNVSYFGTEQDSGRGLKVKILQNSVVKTPTNETLRVFIEKPDRRRVFVDGIPSGDKYIVDFPNSVYAVAGTVKAMLVFNTGTKWVSSNIFTFQVDPSLIDESIESTDDFIVFRNALARMDGFNAQLAQIENDKAEKVEVQNVQSQVNALVVGSGTSSAEVVQSRVNVDGSIFPTAKERLDNIENSIKTGTSKYKFATWEQGGLVYGVENNDPAILSIRIRTKPLVFPSAITLSTTNMFTINVAVGYSAGFAFYSDEACTKFISEKGWNTGTVTVLKKSNYMRIYMKKNSGESINASEGIDLLNALCSINSFIINDETPSNRTTYSSETLDKNLYIKDTVTPTWQDGYINSSGLLVAGTTGGFVYTPLPISLKKGQKITLNGKGYLTNVAMIASYTGSFSNCKVLVLSEDTTLKDYSYTATEDMNIILSANKNAGQTVTITTGISQQAKYNRDKLNEIGSADKYVLDIGIFHKIGGIGDSLMSGEHAYSDASGEHYIDRYNFSWLSNICRSIGASSVHYSAGGLTAKGWLNSVYKTNLMNETSKCSAYFIGLGTNDYNTMPYALGTIDDVAGTDSFVGYYKQIIELVKSTAPYAAIFVCSMYSSGTTQDQYSNMVKSIADLYDMCFYVDFINNTDTPNKSGQYTNWGHYNTLGYVRVANDIKRLVNNILGENISDFAMFGLNNI